MRFLFVAIFLATTTLLIAYTAPSTGVSSFIGGHTMGTTWTVKLRQIPVTPQLQTDIQTLLDRLEQQMSHFRPDSDLSRFNQYRGDDWFPVPHELAEVISIAQSISTQTAGAFDITVAPLVKAWGFGPVGSAVGSVSTDAHAAAERPLKRTLQDIRRHVGHHLLEGQLDPPALRKHDPDVSLDLGGIGKGYAADRVAAHLDALGISEYLISIAGDLRAKGTWRIGIETPTPDTRRILRTLDLTNAALSTSGDYRNFFEKDGQRFSHVIDARTDRPVSHNLASVSVIHPSGAQADALATALMVIGADDGPALAERLKVPTLFILRGDRQFDLRHTDDFPR